MNKLVWPLTVGLSVFGAVSALAQSYPTHYVEMVITTTPGDTQDLSGRAIGTAPW